MLVQVRSCRIGPVVIHETILYEFLVCLHPVSIR